MMQAEGYMNYCEGCNLEVKSTIVHTVICWLAQLLFML